MKTMLLAGPMALALVGCSDQSSEADNENAVVEAPHASEAAAEMAGGPDVAITAAPGVAFKYSYAFRLDDDRIAGIQEEHAAACEKLGVNRCRITGLRYRLLRENEVNAQLQFKLDPAIARRFGKEAIASVTKAEGVLADARITGEDVGTQISDSHRRSADVEAEIKRIEARLKQSGLGDLERAELQQQVSQLRSRQDDERGTRRAGEAMLATTPMTFDYHGMGGLPGIGFGNPFSDAANMLVRSGSTLLFFILVAGAAVLPWALLLALLIFLWRTRAIVAVHEWISSRNSAKPAPPND